MGVFDSYCGICGGPLRVEPEYNSSEYQWLGKIMVPGVSGFVKYDDYGHFTKKGQIVAQVEDLGNDDYPTVVGYHLECLKLNDGKFPKRKLKNDLKLYQEGQFFNWDGLDLDGGLWMVQDPTINSKNKQRILSILGKKSAAKRPVRKSSSRKSSRKSLRKSASRKANENMTVVELRKLCKSLGISGYSGLNKAALIKKCKSKDKSKNKGSLKEMTVVELRKLCKAKGISGYSRLNKAALLKKCK